MADTTNLSIRMERELKEDAERVFNALGMNLTTAITIFVRQQKIPFEISLDTQNDQGAMAMREAIVASERIWQNSVRNGTDKMTPDEINAEISAARAKRKAAEVVNE